MIGSHLYSSPMTEPQQRCGTCRWWTDPGPGADWGDCTAPIPEWVVVDERMGVSRDFSGWTCPTWEARDV